jgi:hypothetical protein
MTEQTPEIMPAGVQQRLIVEAIVIRACSNCGDSRIRDNKYVEGDCPNCGAPLPPVEDLGEIHDSWGEIEVYQGEGQPRKATGIKK